MTVTQLPSRFDLNTISLVGNTSFLAYRQDACSDAKRLQRQALPVRQDACSD